MKCTTLGPLTQLMRDQEIHVSQGFKTHFASDVKFLMWEHDLLINTKYIPSLMQINSKDLKTHVLISHVPSCAKRMSLNSSSKEKTTKHFSAFRRCCSLFLENAQLGSEGR